MSNNVHRWYGPLHKRVCALAITDELTFEDVEEYVHTIVQENLNHPPVFTKKMNMHHYFPFFLLTRMTPANINPNVAYVRENEFRRNQNKRKYGDFANPNFYPDHIEGAYNFLEGSGSEALFGNGPSSENLIQSFQQEPLKTKLFVALLLSSIEHRNPALTNGDIDFYHHQLLNFGAKTAYELLTKQWTVIVRSDLAPMTVALKTPLLKTEKDYWLPVHAKVVIKISDTPVSRTSEPIILTGSPAEEEYNSYLRLVLEQGADGVFNLPIALEQEYIQKHLTFTV